ncbi:MAG: phosphate transport system regulator PhoU, partial [SAR92 clade bacterium]
MTELSFENHIMKQFDEELEEIRTRLMEMGGKVEQQLKNAILSIYNGDSKLAQDVIDQEKFIDQMEKDL